MKLQTPKTEPLKEQKEYLEAAVGRPFTYRYSQPPEYHFCLDSVIFPYFVANRVGHRLSQDARVLDLCAGCGVIGFEFAHFAPAIRQLDFIEIQPVFRSYFEENLAITNRTSHDFRFLEMNYADLLQPQSAAQYDLILSNPPYFFPDEGKLSPSDIKNRCRFFLESDFDTLIRTILHVLKPGGEAYLLVKSGRKHGRDSITMIQNNTGSLATFEVIADIRGTDVVQINKLGYK